MIASEKETIARFDDEERVLHLYTCHERYMNKCLRWGFKPTKEHRDESGRVYAMDFEMPLNSFGLRRGSGPNWVKPRVRVERDRAAESNVEPSQIDQDAPRRKGPRALTPEHKAAMLEGRKRAAAARKAARPTVENIEI